MKIKRNIIYLFLFLTLVLIAILLIVRLRRRPQEGFQNTYEVPSEIILINMDSRTDRLKSFQDSYTASDCSKHGLQMKRISAVIGKDQDWKNGLLTPEATKDMETTIQTGKRNGHESLTPGAIGCYLSHLKAMEYVVQQNKPMIICEDDLVLPSNFYEKVKSALQMVPSGKPVLLLFHVICSGGWDKLKCIELQDNFFEVHRFWSTACYYITPEAAKIFLENSKPLSVQIDAQMARLVEQNKLYIYAYPLAHTNMEFGSDIQMHIQ
jgi:glycosyl transferase family 25